MKDDGEFRSTRATLPVQVQPAFEISISSKPGRGGDAAFLLSFDVENTTPSTSLKISQVTTMSPSWTCHSPTEGYMWVFHWFGDLKRIADAVVSSVDLPPSQVARVAFGVKRWEGGAEGIEETRKYVRRKIGAVLRGEEIDPSEPPPLEVSCTHFSGVGSSALLFYHSSWRISHSQTRLSRSTRKTSRISFGKTNEGSSGDRSRGHIRPYRARLTTRFSHCTTRPL